MESKEAADLWQQRAKTLYEASTLVKEGNTRLAEDLRNTGLAYEQCGDELLEVRETS